MLRTRSGSTFGLATFGAEAPTFDPTAAGRAWCEAGNRWKLTSAAMVALVTMLAGTSTKKQRLARLPWAVGVGGAFYLWDRRDCTANPVITGGVATPPAGGV